jgi:hypothetical protein
MKLNMGQQNLEKSSLKKIHYDRKLWNAGFMNESRSQKTIGFHTEPLKFTFIYCTRKSA